MNPLSDIVWTRVRIPHAPPGHFLNSYKKQIKMRKIVIYKDVEVNGKKQRNTLRSIAPSDMWVGYSKGGMIIDGEAKKLASALEPGFSGYYLA